MVTIPIPAASGPEIRTAADRRPFAGLVLAQGLSGFGNSLTAIAIPWFVLATTGSVARTSVVAAAGVVAMIIATATGSAAVDRLGYRRMSIASDLLSLLSVAAIPILYGTVGLSLPVLVALVFLGGLFDAPGGTARSAMLPELAGWAGLGLERANSLSQGVLGLAQLVGPVSGGLLIGVVGASNVLWFNAATFALSVVIIRAVVPVIRSPAVAERASYLSEVREGWSYVFRQPLIRTILLIATSINVVTTPLFAVLLPALVQTEYCEPRILGFALAAFGAGSLLGLGLYGWLGERLPRLPLLVVGVAVFAPGAVAMAFAPPWPLLLAALSVVGLISAPVNPIAFTAIQVTVPEVLRARTIGAVFAMAVIAAPVGLALAALIVAVAGLPAAFLAAATVLAAGTIMTAVSPELRRLDRTTPSARVRSSVGPEAT